MYTLKKKYEIARDKAIYLMNKGLIKEYISHLAYMNTLKRQLNALYN